jgi:hypothetical protein
MKHAVGLLILLCLLVPALGCDKATPVAPAGAVLTISANPSQVGLNGRSTITVVGRKPDGNPLNPGTEIRLSSDRGTIDPVVNVDSSGRATATFRADSRIGPVKITAAAADASVETTVQVGETDETKPTVLVSVTPSTIALGGEATVTVIARNADGSPVARGERVILTTTLGSLDNDRPTIQANGTATTTLNAGNREGEATITAIVGSSEPATTTADIVLDAASAISVVASPALISRNTAESVIEVTATVTNSRAQPVEGAVVTFQTELGRFDGTASATTDENGEATKTLRVRSSEIPAEIGSFTVTVRTPSSTGTTFLEDSIEVTITPAPPP